MQHPLQTYKIDIFSESGKDYITWSQYNLNNVCSQPHVNFHDDRTHKPIVNDKKTWTWGVALLLELFKLVELHE